MEDGCEYKKLETVAKHVHKSYLIILKVFWSLILMVRATFQETWIIGTIDFTFLTSFHSKRSRASWYWYAGREKHEHSGELVISHVNQTAYLICTDSIKAGLSSFMLFSPPLALCNLQLRGPTFQAMLLHQPTAWTQCTVPALIHTRSPGL